MVGHDLDGLWKLDGLGGLCSATELSQRESNLLNHGGNFDGTVRKNGGTFIASNFIGGDVVVTWWCGDKLGDGRLKTCGRSIAVCLTTGNK